MNRKIEPLDIKVPEQVKLSSAEEEAIKALEKLAKKWPKTLMLFSWSGSLVVLSDSGTVKYSPRFEESRLMVVILVTTLTKRPGGNF